MSSVKYFVPSVRQYLTQHLTTENSFTQHSVNLLAWVIYVMHKYNVNAEIREAR